MYHILPPPPATIPGEYLRTPEGAPGLAGEYFEGENFETPRSRFVDAKVDHTWPDPPLAELPAGLASLSHFSARWQGTLTAPEDGEYEIGLEGNDGFRLILDGETVVEDWKAGAARYKGATRTFRKGQLVKVRIEYYQVDGNRVLRLAWRQPSERQALRAPAPALDLAVQTYLPTGADWYDFWTNQRHAGGAWVTRQAPLEILPLYVRAGSIVPMGPDVQYATQSLEAPYDVRIYPGADARFTVYEDDNETYAYERGARATYELVWNDRARTLTVGARQGGFAGMVRQRVLNITLMTGASPPGREPSTPATPVTYVGKRLVVRF
jgi:alpha-D-xyloside xylohydrolase